MHAIKISVLTAFTVIFLATLPVSSSTNLIIPISGAIKYAKPKFRTDFSDLVVEEHSLKYKDGSPFPMRQNLNYEDGTATCEIVDDPSATGGKSFFMWVYKGQPTSTRFEINWHINDLGIVDEYFVVVRLKLREDYYLEPPLDENPDAWCGVHEILNPFSEWSANNLNPLMSYLWYYECIGGDQGFVFQIDNATAIYHRSDVPTPIVKGEWFYLKTYVKRHRTDGVVKIWMDNTLLLDVSGVRTMELDDFYCIVAKLYDGRILPEKQLWVDTVEIYGQELA